ncbi:MAG TPA: hypothetical protein VGK74_13115 [Symbiobacteriaceae bacterium]|jgi:hypothetical protein
MKRWLGGLLLVTVALSLTASISLASVAGPWWPTMMTTSHLKA